MVLENDVVSDLIIIRDSKQKSSSTTFVAMEIYKNAMLIYAIV